VSKIINRIRARQQKVSDERYRQVREFFEVERTCGILGIPVPSELRPDCLGPVNEAEPLLRPWWRFW
jgi:hypothetical protein